MYNKLYFVAAFISVCATLFSVSFIFCYPLLLLLHVRQFVILFRSYIFSLHSIFSFTSCSVSVLATCSLLLCVVYAAAAVRPDDCACPDALLPSPRVIFIFVSHSVRVGYSIQCCCLCFVSLAKRNITQCPSLDGKSAIHTIILSFDSMFWARLVLMGLGGGVCRVFCSLFSFFSFRFSANTILDVWERSHTIDTKKMDVMNSNASDRTNKKKFKRPNFNAKIKQFSIEIYFMWFSALIYLAETIVGECFYIVWTRLCVRVSACKQINSSSSTNEKYNFFLLRNEWKHSGG